MVHRPAYATINCILRYERAGIFLCSQGFCNQVIQCFPQVDAVLKLGAFLPVRFL